jgi:hypothetical protein
MTWCTAILLLLAAAAGLAAGEGSQAQQHAQQQQHGNDRLDTHHDGKTRPTLHLLLWRAGLYFTVPAAQKLTTCMRSPAANTSSQLCWNNFWQDTKSGKAGEARALPEALLSILRVSI